MNIIRTSVIALTLAASILGSFAQDTSTSSAIMRRNSRDRNQNTNNVGVSERMKGAFSTENSSLSEGDVQWMRILYRQLDLNNVKNAALYYPEEPIDGQENLFRIIMRLLANGQLKAYEYLDGREIFTEKYETKVRDILDRFYIIYNEAKGSTEKNPRFEIDEADVPANEVLSYYVIEKWVYDTRNNRLRPTIEAICPVLHRSGDFGGEAIKYPMFWVKYDDLRPHLAQQMIFVNDDNNLPTCTYDDFFNLTMYDGEIYKTRNLQNKSMAQLYPDEVDRKRAQDSIQNRLDHFEDRLWTPTREELLAAAAEKEKSSVNKDDDSEQNEKAAAVETKEKNDTKPSTTTRGSSSKQSSKKAPKVKQSKVSSSSSAERSVRRRKK